MGLLAPLKTEAPARLSRLQRRSRAPDMARRRGVVGLSFLASLSMQVVALYQFGLLRRMPEPDLPGFDADEVDASEEAYAHLETGDAFIGHASYALTSLLAAMGGPDRVRRRPWLPVLLGFKTLSDAGSAAKLTRDQWVKHRAFCSWCLLAAGATFASLALAAPEAASGLRRLLNARQR